MTDMRLKDLKRERKLHSRRSMENLTQHLDEEDKKEIHKKFGRDTGLGRTVFNLYNKGKVDYTPNVAVKTVKNPVDPHELHQQKKIQANKEVADRLRKKKKTPKLKKQVPEAEPLQFFDAGMGRKPKKEIDMEMREFQEEQQRSAAANASSKKGFASRAKEIESLQNRFENPDKKQELAPVRKVVPKPASPRETECVKMFKEINREVEERERYLEDMGDTLSVAESTRIRGEISDRLRDMKKLNDLIQAGE